MSESTRVTGKYVRWETRAGSDSATAHLETLGLDDAANGPQDPWQGAARYRWRRQSATAKQNRAGDEAEDELAAWAALARRAHKRWMAENPF